MRTDAENSNGLMLRAELLREMGRFEESGEALSSIPQEARSIPLFETMNRLIQDRVDEYGNTPLILAAQAVTILEYTDVITELLRRGANVNRQNNWGETAYSKAKSWNYTQVMKILSEAGADTTLAPEEEETGQLGVTRQSIIKVWPAERLEGKHHRITG